MFYLTIDDDIHIRTLHPSDAEELFQLVEANRARLRPWIHPSALPETLAAARKFTIECLFNSLGNPGEAMVEYSEYFRELENYLPRPNPPMEMGIWFNKRLAGEIMLGRLQDNSATAEFGYWISAEHEGRGIVTRCVSALMDYAVENMELEQFVIGCAANNQRSRAIPEHLGYRLQATVPHGEIVGPYVYNRVIYGMQSSAWRKRSNKFPFPPTRRET